jgi:Ca-activated chloride channel family protein
LAAYRDGKFDQAYNEFQQTLKAHPPERAVDKLQFDSGAAAYKKEDYEKALESFSQALLSPDTGLQAKGHYNLGNTLYQRGEKQKSDDKKLTNWINALDHYQQTLKIEPENKEAKENYEFVKRKIDELKKPKPPPPTPTPSPSPPPKNQKQNQQNQQQQDQQNQQNQQQQNQQQQQQQQGAGQSQQQQKDQQQQQSQDRKSQGQNDQKNENQKSQQQGQSPSPSPSAGENSQPRKNEEEESPSPSPGSTPPGVTPSPSPGEGEGEGEGTEPSATPSGSPEKRMAGELKEAGEQDSQKRDQAAQMADAEAEKEGKMSERQALALLESMKDEEAKVQLDERRAARHVYKDW